MAQQDKMTIIVFSGGLDHAFAAFTLATTAASMGMQVSMFFTFWGLNMVKKNKGSLKSKNWMQKMLNMLDRGGSDRLKMSKLNMFGLGTWMMKRMMKQMNMPSVDQLIVMAHEMGVKLIACTTTCSMMGLDKDAFRPEVDVMAGAAAFLGEAREAKINLFI